VLYVSHQLEKILALTDNVTVLRDGRNAGDIATADADRGTLLEMMVGTQIRTFYAGMGDTYPGLEVHIVREISSGDEAPLEWEADLIAADGKRFPIYGMNFVKVRDGKFTHVRAYFDPTSFPQPSED
jgi:ABC-type uncharacterized transport system ATPase subunit